MLCKSNQSCKCVIDGVGQQGAQVKRFTVRFLPRGQNFLQPCFTRLAQFMKLCCKMFGAVLSSRLESYLSDCSVKSTVFMFLGCLKCLPGLIKLDIKFFFFFFVSGQTFSMQKLSSDLTSAPLRVSEFQVTFLMVVLHYKNLSKTIRYLL